MKNSELHLIGPGRYAFTWMAPWGQSIPAELIVTTAEGWWQRAEAHDPVWAAFEVGPAVVAIRLCGELAPTPLRPIIRAAVPAEWN